MSIRERATYRPVAKYFKKNWGCERTWFAGCGWDMKFPAGFGQSKADVVGCTPSGDLHLGEGKLLKTPAHAFEETFNQLDRFRAYADFLWAFFPSFQWKAAANNHQQWISRLRERGYGLLLVDGEHSDAELRAERNRPDPSRKSEMLQQLLRKKSDEPVPVPTLGAVAAEFARLAVSRVSEIMSGPARELLKGNGRKDEALNVLEPYSAKRFVIIGRLSEEARGGSIQIDGDPLGNWARDGQPVIWVWRGFESLEKCQKMISVAVSSLVKRSEQFGTYYLADNGHWEWECLPISELSLDDPLDDLMARQFNAWFALGRAVAVGSRSTEAMRADLAQLLHWARGLA